MLDTFEQPGKFWRGNLHGHSTGSDGAWSPDEVCAAYRREGYDFIALTDHFMQQYQFPITDTTRFRDKNFTTILGAEVHAPTTSRGVDWHILAVGLPLDFTETTASENGIALARRCVEAGAFVAIAHPHWYNLQLADAMSLDCAHAIEVYNHTCGVRAARGDGAAFWDALLSNGRRITGIAVDDSHFLAGAFDGFGGWVMVKAEENAPDTLLNSLKKGHFYATQGPSIDDVVRVGDNLVVTCSPAVQVFLVGPVAAAEHQEGVSLTRASVALDKFKGSWCRAVVRDAAGRQAWTNPLWLD